MAISDSQKVDLLFKKVGYGVSKTDTSTYKGPTGEANASPLVSPGSTIYQQDYAIPSGTILPTSNSSVVTVYRDSLTSTVQCAKLPTTSANVSWTTGLTDWIPVQYGTGYQVKLYAGPSGSSTPQNFISLPAGGSGNNDDWNFDYQAGVVNFADTNVPTAANQNGNVVYVVGARYTGVKGITTFANLQVANISINGNTITGNTGITFGGNVTAGNVISTTVYSNIIGTLATITSNVTAGNVISNLYGNLIGTSVTLSGNLTAGNLITLGNAYVGNLTVTNLEIDQGNIIAGNVTSTFYGNSFATTYANIYTDYITPNQTTTTTFNSSTAIRLPIGGNIARPNTPSSGQIRYNSDYNTVEFYNGTNWISVVTNISGQNFFGDGSATFTLDQVTTANGILVSINGTVQQPLFAYNVTGDQITFTETPLVTDQIDIRFLAASIVIDNIFNTDISVAGNITLTGLLSAPQTTKASNAIGTIGQMCWDANYIYICTATNTWKRSPLTGGY
jgi:cytoskeletal protein CcmA (bactofilin family)